MLKRACKLEARRDAPTHIERPSLERKATASGKVRRSLDVAEDIRSAQLWLAGGAPIADVMTMLEVRHRFELSPDDCRAYAIGILWAAQDQSQPEANLKSTSKGAALCRCLKLHRPAATFPR